MYLSKINFLPESGEQSFQYMFICRRNFIYCSLGHLLTIQFPIDIIKLVSRIFHFHYSEH